MSIHLSRRRLLQSSLMAAGGTLLAACGSTSAPSAGSKPSVQLNQRAVPPAAAPASAPLAPKQPVPQDVRGGNSVRLFASSGFAEDPARLVNGLARLAAAGFSVGNPEAAYRRFQRFAGSDAERIADFQQVANGSVATPKVLMGVRGGYGAARILPHIDWKNLGARMREHQTLLFGFSDVTAVQLALLAQSGVPSFAGPMLYSEFSKPEPSVYTMDSFIRNTTAPQHTVVVDEWQSRDVRAEGILWGGNLSVLASLVGTPYLPDIQGGILFLEDVSEQPYRIERMLQTLHLAGVLKKQQAIVLGDFRMGNIRDSYDSSYTLQSVANTISRAAGIPVLSGFPFGHIANKTTFPLGAHAQLQGNGNGGYQITFSRYPMLNAAELNLNSLLPVYQPDAVGAFINSSEDTRFE